MRNPTLYRRLWPFAQRAIGAAEREIATPLTEPHRYTLDWLPNGTRFSVDDAVILESRCSPRGALGFVAWIDNQYAIITPQGQLSAGLVDIRTAQWLHLDELSITPLD
jgi:hypothetical protein